MQRPRQILVLLFAVMAFVVIRDGTVTHYLLTMRIHELLRYDGVVVDGSLALARLLGHLGLAGGTSALLMASIFSWLISLPIILSWKRTRSEWPLLFHPASGLFVIAGAGFAPLGLIGLFGAIRQAAESASPKDVPGVGLAMLLSVLTVPHFEVLILPLASALFLTAPRAMMERQMFAYYLVVLMPAVIALGVGAGFGLDQEPLRDEAPASFAAGGPQFAAAALLTAPGVLWSAFRKETRRLAIALVLLMVAIATAQVGTLTHGVLIAGLAAASAVRGRWSLRVEVISAGAVAAAAWLVVTGVA
ncbi:MAG: hypothetical protein AAF788_03780 [Pseudomonadota bacterium]